MQEEQNLTADFTDNTDQEKIENRDIWKSGNRKG